LNQAQTIYIALFVAIAGIAILFLSAPSVKPEKLKISELSNEQLGRYVQLEGTLANVSSREGNVQAKLCSQSDCVRLRVFYSMAIQMRDSGLDPYTLVSGDHVRVDGTVRSYQNELEIVPLKADSVKRVG